MISQADDEIDLVEHVEYSRTAIYLAFAFALVEGVIFEKVGKTALGVEELWKNRDKVPTTLRLANVVMQDNDSLVRFPPS